MSEETSNRRRGWFEAFARFFESPTRSALRSLLKENVGEFNEIDFKASWPQPTKLARHILAMANSGGGVIVIGVAETETKTLVPDGLPSLCDKTEALQSIKSYLPDEIQPEVMDFTYEDAEYAALKGKQFQVILIQDDPEHLPFVCFKDGDDIKAGAIYVRDNVASVPASYLALQKVLNRRIESGRSTTAELTLKDHLEELKVLYGAIRKSVSAFDFLDFASLAQYKCNPAYPREDYEQFVARIIEKKKQVIEDFLMRR